MMNRKHFLGAAGLLVTGTMLRAGAAQSAVRNKDATIPPYLQPGDTIGITAPAGYMTEKEMAPAIALMKSWGFRIRIGSTIGKRDFTFGGTDDERLNDLQEMLDNPEVNAIMCARGGYGSVRIVDRINWTRFQKHPKWIIGFSDITVLHNHIHTQLGIASIHSKMTNSFPDDWSRAEPVQAETILSIRDALQGRKLRYSVTPHAQNRRGSGKGLLVGGNLKTIEHLTGSASDIDTAGKILFVEDAGEYLYSIDRMFWNLKRTGKLKGLKGLVIGGFRIKTDEDTEPFGRTLEEIVLEKVSEYDYPVCFDFPVGHQRANFALKCGVEHQLTVEEGKAELIEI